MRSPSSGERRAPQSASIRDHAYNGAVDAEMLSEGQLVDAFIYKDQVNWTDRYCYFVQNGTPVDALSVCVGEEFALTLQYDQWGAASPQPTAPLGVFDQKRCVF